MTNLVEKIINKEYDSANQIFESKINEIVETKLLEMKKATAVKMEQMSVGPTRAEKLKTGVLEEDDIEEEQELDEASRFKIVKARIRGGKIQRRRKVATQAGFTMRGGRITRMSAAERRRRKMGQRRGKLKRKAKLSRALMKRKRSLMKRRSIGLR